MRSRLRRPLLLALLAAALAGCECPKALVSLDQLVTEYNANADGLPRLRAQVQMSVTIDTPDGPPITWRSGSPTCLLLLEKAARKAGPHDFVLIGREMAGVELFRTGSSSTEGVYYFWFRFGEQGGAWFGRHANAGAPAVAGLPIDPMQLLGVLAVCRLPSEPDGLPGVALGMQNAPPDDCAYVVTVIDRQPGTNRLLLKREMFFRWNDEHPRRPYKVNLLDPAGRRLMTAHLKDYKPIDVSELDEIPDTEPVMPTDIELVSNPFPGVATSVQRIHLVLSEMTAADIWLPSACEFKPPAGLPIIDVDRPGGTPPAERTEE